MTTTTISIALSAFAFVWTAISAVLTGLDLVALRRAVQAYSRRRRTRCLVLHDSTDLASRLRERGFAAAAVHGRYPFIGLDVDEAAVLVLVDPTAEQVSEARGRTHAPILVLTRQRIDVPMGGDVLLCNHEVRLVGDLAVVVEGR